MQFTMKDLLQAIGPSASLIFASWIFLSFLQTRYTAAYERYRQLIQERREQLHGDGEEPGGGDRRHAGSIRDQIELYRRRCEQMRLATNIGVAAAVLLIVTILCGGMQVVMPHAALLSYVGALGAFLGLALLV